MNIKLFFLSLSIIFANPDILISQDTTDGIIWYPVIQLSDSTHNAYEPRIALSGEDTVHVTWTEPEDIPPGLRLPYARSINGGEYFELTRELLTDSVLFPYHGYNSWILARDNYVWIFFAGATPHSYYPPPLHMIRSYDCGNTWSQVVDITTESSGEVSCATICRDSIAIVYPSEDSGRRILRSSNGGLSWTRTNETIEDHAKIALTSNKLHLVQHKWISPAVEIQYRCSTNLGTKWEIDTILSTIDVYWSDIPTIAGYTSECGTELLAAWRDVKYGWYVFYGASIISLTSLTNGNSWLQENVLTPAPQGSVPMAAIHGNTRAVIWLWEVSWDTIQTGLRATNYSLKHYYPMINLAPNALTAMDGSVTTSRTTIHAVWEQKVGSTFRILYRRGEFIPSNAELTLPTSHINMDTTEAGKITTDTVLVTNTGIGTLVIGTAISNNENFTVTPESASVAPLNSYPFIIHFKPRLYGNHEGKIIFYHNGLSSPDCFDVRGFCVWSKDTVTEYRKNKWNMVSTPLKYGANNRMPSLIYYDSSYIATDSMIWGKGYWAKPIDTAFVYRGLPVMFDSINVKTGWNLIGSLTGPVVTWEGVTTIPDSIIESLFYHFNGNGYVNVDTIKPGRSYWVKVSQNGKLIMKAIGE